MRTNNKQCPILFSTPMVQAIEAGIKTQTRRIIEDCTTLNRADSKFVGFTDFDTIAHFKKIGGTTFFAGYNPKYLVGDTLWVRETFLDAQDYACSDYDPNDPESGPRYSYKADCPADQVSGYFWKPSIHMPKEAARYWLLVKAVGVERLNDISEQDAIAEGIKSWESPVHPGKREYLDYSSAQSSESGIGFVSPETSYMSLWEQIHGRESWKVNPFVWVYTFERVEKPAIVC